MLLQYFPFFVSTSFHILFTKNYLVAALEKHTAVVSRCKGSKKDIMAGSVIGAKFFTFLKVNVPRYCDDIFGNLRTCFRRVVQSIEYTIDCYEKVV